MKTLYTRFPLLGALRLGHGWLRCLLPALMALSACGAGIPEPDTLLYGTVFHRHHIYQLVVTNGTLDWTIRLDETGARSVTVHADLESLGNGDISYRVRVPHEALASGFTAADLSADALPLEAADTRYRHHDIRVNGQPARIIPPAIDSLNLSQARRLAAYRIDLAVSLGTPDTDGDGLPDWWEDKFGFDKFAADANGDRDGDGLSNLAEYQMGSNPNAGDAVPKIVWENASIGEGGTEVIALQAVDSDTPANRLVYTVVEPPTGGRLAIQFGATNAGPAGLFGDRILRAGDTFTQEQVDAGELILKHEDLSRTLLQFRVKLSDGDVTHPAFDTVVSLQVRKPTPENGSGAALWTDASFEAQAGKGPSLTKWSDRSGPKPWFNGSDAPYDAQSGALPLALESRGPIGQPVVAFNLPGVTLPTGPLGESQTQFFAPPSSSQARVFHDSNVTVFAVIKANAEGTHRGQIVNGPHFQLTMTGAENHGRESQVRFATESGGVVYGNRTIPNRWSLVTAWADAGSLNLQLDASLVGGPHPQGESAEFGSDPLIGGRKHSAFDPSTGQNKTIVDEPFQGHLGEVLVFNRALLDTERQRINFQLLSKWFGWVLLDGTDEFRDLQWKVPSSRLSLSSYKTNFVPRHGADHNYILVGGVGNDQLRGGHNDDILVGGLGQDSLTGNGGRDVFLFNRADQDRGSDTITDFRPSQDHDAIDLTELLQGDSRNLVDYIRLRTDGQHSYMDLDFEGKREYGDHTIVLQNIVLRNDDLYDLWARTNLITGDKRFALPVSLTATVATATEISGQTAEFTVHFGGQSVPDGLEIPFETGGTAVRGVDYRLSTRTYHADTDTYGWEPLSGNELFVKEKVGDLDFAIRVEPIADNRSESPETVVLHLTAVPEFFDLTVPEARVTIMDGLPTVGVIVTDDTAGETGDRGTFLLSRRGSLDVPLDVTVHMTGPAENGVDYGYIPTLQHFNPGQSNLVVVLQPYADNIRELPESAELVIDAGSGYSIDPTAQAATLLIQDSGPIITVEAVESLAVVLDGLPGAFLLRRQGMINEPLNVVLEFGGSATMNVDYRRVSRIAAFAAGATTVLLPITPLPGASLEDGAETIDLRILPDAAYSVGLASVAQVRLVNELLTFGQWKAVKFPGNATSASLFAKQDTDRDGIINGVEYAFGLDPVVSVGQDPGLPHASIDNGHLTVQFTRFTASVDVTYVLEQSTDLIHWEAAGTSFVQQPAVILGGGLEQVTFVDQQSITENLHRFIRVRSMLP